MRRTGLALLALALLLAVGLSVGLGAWLLAEEAGVAPPPERVAREVAREVRPAVVSAPDPDEPAAEDDTGSPRAETCPGRVRLQMPDGTPFDGAVQIAGVWRPLDDGETFARDRPCGNQVLRARESIDAPGARAGLRTRVVVRGEQPLVVEVGWWGEAEVETVDPAGRRVEAFVAGAEQLEPGLFQVEGRGETRFITVGLPGEFGRTEAVPLDGERHLVVVQADRVVALTLLCDDCPERVVCERSSGMGSATCRGRPPDLQCPCPPEGGTLMARTADALLDYTDHVQPLAAVGPTDEGLVVDVRGPRGSVEGRLLGADRWLRLRRPGSDSRHLTLEDDGAFELDGLFAGDWELVIRTLGVPGEAPSREEAVPFTLMPGEHLDLGDVEPTP